MHIATDEEYSATPVNAFSRESNCASEDDTQLLIELEERLDCTGEDFLREEKAYTGGNSIQGLERSHAHKKLQRLKSEMALEALAQNELELKANLFYHIGNPIKRWRVEKVVPAKLVLQLLKTFCLVVQVYKYTHRRPMPIMLWCAPKSEAGMIMAVSSRHFL